MTYEFDLSSTSGLSEIEAAKRLQEEGYNELPFSGKRSIFRIAFEIVREPMFLLLVACGTIYLLVGDLQDALLLLCFVFVVMGITLFQERKTERALEALQDLSSPRALVIRDGETRRIPGREVVRGDILVLSEGDRVPADAVVLSCLSLSVDESLLTGESAPVRKVPCVEPSDLTCPGGDDLPFVYSGTLVVQGRGVACVKAVGMQTELGKIGSALQSVETEETFLQRETSRLVRLVALFGLSLCAVVVSVYGLIRGNWLSGALAGITLAMAILPEEIPVVLTIFLALGAWRISQKRVLTRRMPAIETLGSATVLCVDKTGTLTLNEMSVSRLVADGIIYRIERREEEPLPESHHELLEFGILASQQDPFDPMEKALIRLGKDGLKDTEHLRTDWQLVHAYPLSRSMLSLSHVWTPRGEDASYVIAAKGAPEAIADLCHLNDVKKREMGRQVSEMAEQGLRVLGVAKARLQQPTLPESQHDFSFEFLGLVGFEDPVRPEAPEAIRECYRAGMRVVMITGDYPGTAQSIARQIGLESPNGCISGAELNAMDDAELRERIASVNIFARVVPEQKLRLVNALKECGDIVAMTGDGVNDAPALKSAHIGIAMGGRGTDVAREAAALVLLDDSFSSIVGAVKLGRRIFDNLRKAMAYIFAIHVPIAGMSLLPILIDWPLVLFPIHIVFLQLIIDPACSIVFEAEADEADLMDRPPRNPKERLFGGATAGMGLVQGLIVFGTILAVYTIALFSGHGEQEVRALTFTCLIIANLSIILSNRSWSSSLWAVLRIPNPALWWVVGGALTFLGLVLFVPFLRDLFRFGLLSPLDLLLSLASGLTAVGWFEVLKILRRGRVRRVKTTE